MQDLSLLYSFLLVVMALLWGFLLLLGKHLLQERKLLLFVAGFTLRLLYRFFLVVAPHPSQAPIIGEADLLVDTILGVATAQMLMFHYLYRFNFYTHGVFYRFFTRRFSVVVLGVLLFVLVLLLSPLRGEQPVLCTVVSLASFYEFTVYLAAFLLTAHLLRRIPSTPWRIVLYVAFGFLMLAPLTYGVGLLWRVPPPALQAGQSLLYLFGFLTLTAFFQDPERALAFDRHLVDLGRHQILTPVLRQLLLEEERDRKTQELEVFNPERYLQGYREGRWVEVLEPVVRYLMRDFPGTPILLGQMDPLHRRVTFTHRVPSEGAPLEPLEPAPQVQLPRSDLVTRWFRREELRGPHEDLLVRLSGNRGGGFSLPLAIGPHLYVLWIPCEAGDRSGLFHWLQAVQGRVQQLLNYAYDYLRTLETQHLHARFLAVFTGAFQSDGIETYLEQLGLALVEIFPEFALLTVEGTEIRVLQSRGDHPGVWPGLLRALDIYELRRKTTTPSQHHQIPGLEGAFSFVPLQDPYLLGIYHPPSEPLTIVQQIREAHFFEHLLPLIRQHLQDVQQFFHEKKVCWFSQQLSETLPQQIETLSLEDLARSLLDTARKLSSFPAVSLFLVDPENNQRLQYVATSPEHRTLPSVGWLDLRSSPALLSVRTTLQPIYSQDREGGDLLAHTLGFHSWVIFPLHLESSLLGFIVFHAQSPHPPMTATETQMMEQFTHFASFILFWSLTRREHQQQEKVIQNLLNALAEMLPLTNEESLQQKIVEVAQELLEGDAASFMVYDRNLKSFVITAARGLSERYIEGQRIPGERVRSLMGSGYAPVYIRNLQERFYGDLNLIREENLRSVIAVFIRREEQVYGLLNVYTKGEVRQFSTTKRQLFSYLAVLTSALLKNIYLYHAALRHSKILETLNALGRYVIRYINTPEASWRDLLGVLADMLNCPKVYLIRYQRTEWVDLYGYTRRAQAFHEERLSIRTFRERFPDLPPVQELAEQGVYALPESETYTLYLTQTGDHHWLLRLESPLLDLLQEDYMDVLQGIADLLSLGLIGMTHFENERRRSEDIALINQLLRLTFAAEHPERALEGIFENLRGRLAASWLAVVDPRKTDEEDPFQVLAPAGARPEAQRALKQHRESLLKALRLKEILQARQQDRIRLGVPLIGRHGPQGVLFLEIPAQRYDPGYTPAFLETLGSELAAVLENVALSRQTQETLQRLETTQMQLIESSKLAAIGGLAAGVAHEIKNPLFIIQGTMEIWKRKLEKGKPVLTEEIEKVLDAVARINHIVRSLLDYARSTQEKTVARVHVHEAILGALGFMKRSYEKEGIRLELDFDPEMPPILANRGEIMQVVSNLVQNARDAIVHSKKGDSIVVSTRFTGDALEISVWDNGPGIPPDLHQQIFEPFFSTKPPGEGTGLGLSIVKRLVEKMGGTLALNSEEGQYTEFVVRIPYTPPPEQAPEPHRAAEESPPDLFQGKRFLVVDDEENITEIVAQYLQDLGARVVSFNDPRKALQRARFDRFDALILDIRMPEVDGFQIYEDLQERNPENARRVIFLTGGVGDQSIRTYLENHRLPYLTKPVSLDDLRHMLEHLLTHPEESAEPKS